MIAEIKNKMTSAEDELTGNFFGTLRYVKFENVLLPILVKTIHCDDDIIKILKAQKFNEERFEFWKRADDLGEIDCYFENEDIALGIEVTYNSGLSSEDQLIREAKMLNKWAPYKIKMLLLIAKNKVSCEIPFNNNKVACKLMNVILAWISWKEVYNKLEEIKKYSKDNSILLNDLLEFLKAKGFDSFKSFEIEDLIAVGSNFVFEYKSQHSFYFDVMDAVDEIFYVFRR